MNFRFLSLPPSHLSLALAFAFLILVYIHPSFAFDGWSWNCSPEFDCGNISKDYLFWRNDKPERCGDYQTIKESCEGNRVTINILEEKYQVLGSIWSNSSLIITKFNPLNPFCPPRHDASSAPPVYAILPIAYQCQPPYSQSIPDKTTCPAKPGTKFGFIPIENESPGAYCKLSAVISIASSLFRGLGDLQNLLQQIHEEFASAQKVDTEVCRSCSALGGICNYDLFLKKTRCYCQSRYNGFELCPSSPIAEAPAPSTEKKTESSKNISLVIGVSIGGACFIGIILGCCIYYCLRRKKKHPIESRGKDPSMSVPLSNKDMPAPLLNSSQTIPSYPFSISDIERGSSYYGVQVFSYTELEKVTDNFDRSRELGDGGFGTVYYGKLHDGREVAVKRLYENNCKRVEQFVNEVHILADLKHQNLVKLYGCTSKRSQGLLLVYEYIPNGTVADHLHGRRAKSGLLSWPVRLRIAIETADALTYLHRSDIIHRDVKTNNILLDKNFTVKVADFGLSRLFPTHVTHVSTAPQGTPGYVDPEYYQCYQLTSKSDVYSFGVVLIELISSLQAVDTNRKRQDINLSNMAVSKIQSCALNELVDPNLGFDKNYEVRRMTTSVAKLAFRCLQQDRDMRPSMEEVLEILRGIHSEESIARTAEVVDVRENDVGLSKNTPPSFSPDSVIAENWVSSSTTTNSL